ncbi:MAG: hypothetical protein QOC54_3910, partial [Baekduia sp.]|nr:hypothetical protein [Baekduia sp.]
MKPGRGQRTNVGDQPRRLRFLRADVAGLGVSEGVRADGSSPAG